MILDSIARGANSTLTTDILGTGVNGAEVIGGGLVVLGAIALFRGLYNWVFK